MSHQTVIVLDFGGQYNQLIARRVRECGVYCEVKPYTTPLADIRAMIQVSVTSLAELTRVFLQPMLERGRGRILNMSSMMAKTPCPYNALYGAAKAFVLSFSTALARELRGTGVTVTTACPGATRTNFAKNAGIQNAPAWKYFSMDADETAIRVYRALMRGELCAVTGWYNKGGAVSVRLMPMGMQLSAGEWLMGKRKHPLDHEGTESSDARDGKGEGKGEGHGNGEGKDGRDGSDGEKKAEQREGGASGKGGKKRCSCKRAHGQAGRAEDGPYRVVARDNSASQRMRMRDGLRAPQAFPPTYEYDPARRNPEAGDPCGGGRGWRAATLGCARAKQDQGKNRDKGQAGPSTPPPGGKRHAGPWRDGVPASLGRFAWHGPFAK